MKRRLIVFAKRPLPGYAKTRLAGGIGSEGAAGVYARLLYTYLLDLLSVNLADVVIELSMASPAGVGFFGRAFPELVVRPQVQGALGERMAAAFERAFVEGAEVVVLTGSDVVGLSGEIVAAAFDALNDFPVVVGPATDGGYYLIGMRAPGNDLFQGVEWSTNRVLGQTLALARERGLQVAHVRELFDMDTEEAYERWRRQVLLLSHGRAQVRGHKQVGNDLAS